MRLIRTAMIVTALAALVAGTALAQATPATPAAPAAPRPQASRTPHRTLNKDDCLSCHAVGANQHVKAVPEAHRYGNPTCVRCHRVADTLPSRSQHAFDATHTRCAACHVAGNTTGAQPTPAAHSRFHTSTCVMCHEPQGGS